MVLRICDTGTSSKLTCPAGDEGAPLFAGAEDCCAGAAVLPGTNPSTSFFTILPLSPLPATCEISIPFSAANFLARGEALILPSALMESPEPACPALPAGEEVPLPWPPFPAAAGVAD